MSSCGVCVCHHVWCVCVCFALRTSCKCSAMAPSGLASGPSGRTCGPSQTTMYVPVCVRLCACLPVCACVLPLSSIHSTPAFAIPLSLLSFHDNILFSVMLVFNSLKMNYNGCCAMFLASFRRMICVSHHSITQTDVQHVDVVQQDLWPAVQVLLRNVNRGCVSTELLLREMFRPVRSLLSLFHLSLP